MKRLVMKKALVTAAVCALFLLGAGQVFAEITWSGGGRAVVVPFGIRFANSDNDAPEATYFGAENPWSGDGPRIGLTVEGKREEGNMGFRVALNLETFAKLGNPIDDNAANVWLKPFGGALETLKFTVGMYQVDTLRFNHAGSGSSFHNYVMYNRGDLSNEEQVFARFHGGGFSTHLEYKPIENLYLGVALGSVGDSRSFAGEFREDGFVNALMNAQVALGYTIPDIGLIRLQYLGAVPDLAETTALDKTLNKIGNDTGGFQAAFNLKAVKDVDIDVGISVPFVNDRTEGLKIQNDMVGSVFFDMNTRPFRLWGLASAKFGGYTDAGTKVENGTNIAVMITPMYYIRNDLILLADIFVDSRTGSDQDVWTTNPDTGELTMSRYDGDPTVNPAADAKNNYFDVGFGAYIRKNIAGGDIRAGITCKLPGGEGHEGASPQIFFPVMFNYGF